MAEVDVVGVVGAAGLVWLAQYAGSYVAGLMKALRGESELWVRRGESVWRGRRRGAVGGLEWYSLRAAGGALQSRGIAVASYCGLDCGVFADRIGASGNR